MDSKENKKLMEDIAAERRETLRPDEIAKLDEAKAAGERAVATYNHAEDAEDALETYLLAMPKAERDALRADDARYDAVSRIFYGAKDKAEMDSYMGKTVSELFAIMTERDVKALEQEG